ncbi:MAG: 50S ribosomal protein L24 [Candidatus Micrarchaeota archaeon]|nr:50S ribosomal protein L24 [Candidatus Micrarchaeota archaeon]
MASCSFCGKPIRTGTGLRVFKRDGTSLVFCSRKCGKYSSRGAKAAKLKWTAGRKG